MSPSQIRSALAGAIMTAALTPMLAVHAATISYTAGSQTTRINDSACSGFTVSGSTLICQSAGGGGTPPVTAPTNCATNLSPSQLTSAGGLVTFGVTGCTSATGQINYNWVENGAYVAYGASTPTWSKTLPANASTTTAQTYSYQVNVCDPGNGQCTGLLPVTPLTATVPVAGTINPTGGGGGGAPGPIASCSGFANVYVLDFGYAHGRQYATSFTDSDIVVAKFTTPSSVLNNGNGGSINHVTWSNANPFRFASLSTTPCDFTANAQSREIANTFTVTFGDAGVALQPNTTYYFNVRNVGDLNNTPTCGGNCPIAIEFTPK